MNISIINSRTWVLISTDFKVIKPTKQFGNKVLYIASTLEEAKVYCHIKNLSVGN